jgi:hypothetical protein
MKTQEKIPEYTVSKEQIDMYLREVCFTVEAQISMRQLEYNRWLRTVSKPLELFYYKEYLRC